MKKLFLLLAVIMATTVTALAQNRSISGVVLEAETGDPLFGATVQPIGGGQGTSTDADGKFQLSIPASVHQVRVAYVGMAEQTVNVSDKMVIKLSANDNVLSTVIVTGYGSGKKIGSLVGSVSVVGDQVLEDTPSSNFVDALQGQVPGLAIFSNSGEPSSVPSSIRIRGVNSLNASTTPLFILDGAPVTSSVFTTINPSDIESVTVLKDAASTAIYGSRAANGVIVITTKKGRYGETAKVTVRADIGWSDRASSTMKMMNAKQYQQFRNLLAVPGLDGAVRATPLTADANYAIDVLGIDTNWLDELIKKDALLYSVEARVQGGTDKTRYYLSLGHYDQDGLIVLSGLKRQTLSTNIDSKVNDWFQVGLSGNFGYETYESNTAAEGRYFQNPFSNAYALLPFDSPYYYDVENDKAVFGDKALFYRFSDATNPNWYSENTLKGKRTTVTAMMNLYEQITPLKGLTFRAQQAMNAFDYRSSSRRPTITPFETPMGDVVPVNVQARTSEAFQRWYQFTYTNTAEYKFNIKDLHYFTALVGQESIISRNNAFNVATTGQPSTIQWLLTQGTEITMDNVGQSLSKSVINSYFLNLNYEFDGRYFLDFNIRRDGSSKFAPERRWATFFAVGAMWDAKAEKFLQPVTWIDDLKVRLNYGTTGNSGISDYSYQGTVGSGRIYAGQSSLGIGSQANHDLTWETVRAFDFGVDFGFINVFRGTVDVYKKQTVNMLLEIPYSCTTGFTGGMANIGSMKNVGVDFELTADIFKNKDWYVGASVNFGYNDTKITELFNGLDKFEIPGTGLTYEVGVNPFNLHQVRSAGLDMRDGQQLYYTADGNITKQYNEARDEVDLGKAYIAPWNGGFGVQARYKNLSLRADFNWSAKKYVTNSTFWYTRTADVALDQTLNQMVEMLDVWYPGKPEYTDIPAATDLYGNPVATEMTDRFVENASFMRLKNLTVTYNLPKKWMTAAKMNNVALHFTSRNLFTVTGFHGIDPEIETNAVHFRYPNTRQFEFGVEVAF